MERAITQESGYLRSIFDSIFDEIVILDDDYTILDVNKTFCAKYRVSKDEAIGSKCYKITHGLNMVCKPSKCKCPVEHVLKTGEFCEAIHCHQKDGEEIYVELLAYPIRIKSGKIKKVVKIGRDITERKIAEKVLKESEKKFRKLFKNFPFSIFLLDSNKKIYDCNGFAEIYLNKSKEDLIEKEFFNLFTIPKKKKESLDELISNVINFGLSEIVEFKFLNYNAKKTWVEIFFSLVNLGNKKYVQIVLQDITERKLVERIIKEENKRLRELNQIKKQLMLQLSENLKSPLQSIFDFTEILLNSYKDQLDQEVINLLKLIKSGGEKSIDMVGKILDISVSEFDTLKLNKQTESLSESINETVNEIDDKIKNKGIVLSLHILEDLYSEIDKIRIKQIIKHFILNARENGYSKQKIMIFLNRKKNHAEISIKYDKIRLNELKSLSKSEISKKIINLHGGKIIVNSERKKKEGDIIIQLPIKNWKESLIHLYVIYKSGIPLYDHTFIKNKDDSNATLISGGIIGMITILKAIIRGKKQIKTIDHGDRKIMFETNNSEDVIFVLIVKEDIIVFRKKLSFLIERFDKEFQYLLKNIKSTSSFSKDWKNLESLIKKIF